MAALAPTNRVPLEVYLTTSWDPDAEYVDGVIEERPVGDYDHSSWQHAIELWFAQHAKEWDIRIRPDAPYPGEPEPISGSRCDDPRS